MIRTGQGDAVPGLGARRIRVRVPVALLLGVYLVGVGMLGGMALSAMKFDQHRSAVLAQFTDASTRLRAQLMQIEKEAEREPSPKTQASR